MNERLAQVRCFLLDMDGTFYLGDHLLDGALRFAEDLADFPDKPTCIFDHLGAVANWPSTQG